MRRDNPGRKYDNAGASHRRPPLHGFHLIMWPTAFVPGGPKHEDPCPSR
jgi:hypothetical protein